MKKVLIAVTAMALMAGVTAISVNAAEEKDMKGYVTVSTSTNTEISPDVVEVSIAVKTSDAKSMQKATLDNKETSDKVYNALKLMIDTTKGDYIKTSDTMQPLFTDIQTTREFWINTRFQTVLS